MSDLKQNTQTNAEFDAVFEELVGIRTKYRWKLAALVLLVYYGFILIIAFAPEVFATKIAGGSTSLGIVVGLGVILFSFVVTGLYVRKANRVFEPLAHKLLTKVREDV